MREILFRGKRTDNGEWVEGYIYPAVGRDVGKWLITEVYDTLMESHTYQADPATVGQYTGLTDRNGKRIFEGDILRCQSGAYEDCIVVFNDCCASFQLKHEDECCEGFLESTDHRSMDIIGNVHDNAELLEADA